MTHVWRTVVACALLIGGLASAVGAQTRSGEGKGSTVAMSAPASVPGIIPTGFGEPIDRDIARVRAATASFKTVEAAIAAGYGATTTCVAHPAHGAMGLHYKNASLRDATLDVEHPEILLYAPSPGGGVMLTGVEYVVPFASWTRDEPPTILAQPLRREETLQVWYLHAWIWQANPAGIFADFNPSVKC